MSAQATAAMWRITVQLMAGVALAGIRLACRRQRWAPRALGEGPAALRPDRGMGWAEGGELRMVWREPGSRPRDSRGGAVARPMRRWLRAALLAVVSAVLVVAGVGCYGQAPRLYRGSGAPSVHALSGGSG